MRIRFLLALLAATAIAPTAALAQNVEGGAAAGAAVGGPIGAGVGAVVGGTVGLAAPPPPEVDTYVEREDVPSVTVEEPVVVGRVLPETVVVHPIPKYHYAYAVVNHERVIIEPHTRKVIKIIKEKD